MPCVSVCVDACVCLHLASDAGCLVLVSAMQFSLVTAAFTMATYYNSIWEGGSGEMAHGPNARMIPHHTTLHAFTDPLLPISFDPFSLWPLLSLTLCLAVRVCLPPQALAMRVLLRLACSRQ